MAWQHAPALVQVSRTSKRTARSSLFMSTSPSLAPVIERSNFSLPRSRQRAPPNSLMSGLSLA